MANVLIVEDQTDLREVWAEELSLLGNQVQGAADGVEGWEIAQQNVFDIIVLDIGLPHRSGVEVLRDIRRVYPVVPVVVVTAITDPSIVRQMAAAGANQILFKPVALDNLAETISRLSCPSQN